MREHIDAYSQLPNSGSGLIDLHAIDTAGVQRECQAHASDPAADDGDLHFALRASPPNRGRCTAIHDRRCRETPVSGACQPLSPLQLGTIPCVTSLGNCDPAVTRGLQTTSGIADLNMKLVGGPGFEPGASRSRTLRTSCPPVSTRFLQCPPVLDFFRRRVLACPPLSSWFRECVTRL